MSRTNPDLLVILRSMARKCFVAASAISLLAAGVNGNAINDDDAHSTNVTEVASLALGEGLTDIAFWDDLAVVARFPGFAAAGDAVGAGFSVVDISTPSSPAELSRFVCNGGGWDVSMWEHLVFLSVDSYTPTETGSCSSGPGRLRLPSPGGVDVGYIQPKRNAFQGLKVVSIADPTKPVQVGSIELPCSGSHTNTVVPDLANGRVLIYAASLIHSVDWPPEDVAQGCDMIVEVPLDDPAAAHVVGRLPGGAGRPQCHDLTYFAPRKLLAGACYAEWRLYDMTDPAAPELISVTVNPLSLQHGAAFSNDGNTLVTGDEGLSYADDPASCLGGTGSTNGAIWFYDITIPAVPVLRSYHQLQHGLEPMSPSGAGGCSAHYFNVIPTRNGRDVLVSAWYAGGMSAVDFTDIGAPTEIAYYQPSLTDPSRRAWYWSAYWYRGHVYATNAYRAPRQSLDVYAIDDPAIGDTYRLPHLNPQSQEALTDVAE